MGIKCLYERVVKPVFSSSSFIYKFNKKNKTGLDFANILVASAGNTTSSDRNKLNLLSDQSHKYVHKMDENVFTQPCPCLILLYR